MLSGLVTHILPHQCCSHSQMLFTRCVRFLRLDAPRKFLHSRAEILIRPRFPTHFHSQFRGVKTRNSKFKGQEEEWKTRNKTILTYIAAAGVGMIGLSYAAVPLYRLYCQVCCTPCTLNINVVPMHFYNASSQLLMLGEITLLPKWLPAQIHITPRCSHVL